MTDPKPKFVLWPHDPTPGADDLEFYAEPPVALLAGQIVWCAQIVPNQLVRGTIVGANATTGNGSRPDCYYVDLGAELSEGYPYPVVQVLYSLILVPEDARRVSRRRAMSLLEVLPFGPGAGPITL